MKKNYLIIGLLIFSAQCIFAQFNLGGEFRPRAEYRNGYNSIIPENAEAGFAISSRIRLNADYKTDAYQFYLSLQDVAVWGENRQTFPADNNNTFSIFEAWAKLNLGSGFTTKLGRQAIAYDDERILGGLNWAQQGRNHDAGLISYNNERFMIDAGFAFNQDFNNPSGFQSIGTAYNTLGSFSYKTMQYLYLKQQWSNFSGSLLFLNNGFQNFEGPADAQIADGISNLQTFGTHLKYNINRFNASFNGFIQTGERQNELDVNGAYLVGLQLNYKATERLVFGLGTEISSGTKGDNPDKTQAFFPLYGTNHGHNGFMDYFYVGNHANSIGLVDIHASANIKIGDRSGLLVKVLNFSGEQELPSGTRALGTELDLVYSQEFNGYGFKIGYSQMFASDGMYELKGVPEASAKNSQNWAWAMLTIKPNFLNTAKSE